jgi:Sulfatase
MYNMLGPPISDGSAVRILALQLVGLLLLLFSPWRLGGVVAQEDTEANGGGGPSAVSPPNILVFIVDDLGWNQVGYHAKPSGNNEIRTPHIDAAAAAGIELNRGYVTPWSCLVGQGFTRSELFQHGPSNHE